MAKTEFTTLQKKDRYKFRYKNFNWIVPENYIFGFDVVDQWAEDRTKLALISVDRTSEKVVIKLTKEYISSNKLTK